MSDAEAKARADFDIRWKVALGIEIEDRPFAKSTLQVFRAQLILHDKVREVFEGSLRLARESGYLQKRGMKVALDTTNILGRGAVKDTCNLLADGIVKLLRALAQLKGINVGQWAKSQGYHRYLGSSVKGEAAIDWADRQARAGLLAGIVGDADRLLELSRQAQGELPEDSAERQRIVDAAELLGRLLLQDVERTDDGVSLKDELGATPAWDCLLGRLTLSIKLPMPPRVLVRRVKYRFLEEQLFHVIQPRKRSTSCAWDSYQQSLSAQAHVQSRST